MLLELEWGRFLIVVDAVVTPKDEISLVVESLTQPV